MKKTRIIPIPLLLDASMLAEAGTLAAEHEQMCANADTQTGIMSWWDTAFDGCDDGAGVSLIKINIMLSSTQNGDVATRMAILCSIFSLSFSLKCQNSRLLRDLVKKVDSIKNATVSPSLINYECKWKIIEDQKSPSIKNKIDIVKQYQSFFTKLNSN